MAGFERVIDVDAPAATVWSLIEDVENWPSWTPTILSVVRLETGAFGLGSTAKVHAKGFPESVLRVTEFTPGRSFTWVGPARAGLRVPLGHAVEPSGSGSRVRLWVEVEGPTAVLLGWMVGRMAKGNVNIEAESLKARAESIARGS
jgi:hypothetical protein